MQRVKGRRQHFTGKRPATESIWIPKRHMAMPHGVDPKAEPAIGVVDPSGPASRVNWFVRKVFQSKSAATTANRASHFAVDLFITVSVAVRLGPDFARMILSRL
jgi:hypothetical protein